MVDNGPLKEGLSTATPADRGQERRDFLRRASLIGLPVALATVRPRTVWAAANDTPSCHASIGTSGCENRPPLVVG